MMRTRIKSILAMTMCAALLFTTVADPLIYTAYASPRDASEPAKESGAVTFVLSDGTVIADGELTFTKGSTAVTPQLGSAGGYVFPEEPGEEIGYKFTRKGVKDVSGTVKLTKDAQSVTLNIVNKKENTLTKTKDLTASYLDGSITLEGLVTVTEGYDGVIAYSVLSGTAFTVAEKTLTPVSVGEGVLRVTAPETKEYKEAILDIPLTVTKGTLGVLGAGAFSWTPTGKLYDGLSEVSLAGQLIDTSVLKAGDNVTVKAEATLDNALGGDANAVINSITLSEGADKYTLTIADGASVPFSVSFAVTFALSDGSGIADGELTLTKGGEVYLPATDGAGQYTFKDTVGTEIGYLFQREGYKPLYGSFALSTASQVITLDPVLKDNVVLTQAKEISAHYMDGTVSIDGLVTASEGYDGALTYSVIDGSAFTVEGTTLTVLAPGTGTIRAYASGTDNYNANYLDITLNVGKKELGSLTADDFAWGPTSKVYDGNAEVTVYGTLIDTSVLAEGDTFTVEATATLDSAEAGERTAAIKSYTITGGADKYMTGGISGSIFPYNVWFTAAFVLEDGSDIADGELWLTKNGEAYTPEGSKGAYIFTEAPETVIGYGFNREGYKPLSGTITLNESAQTITLAPVLKDDSTLTQAMDLSLQYMDAPVSIEGLVTAPEGYDGTIFYQVTEGTAFAIDGTTLTVIEPGTGNIRATASETDYFNASYIDIPLTIGKKDLSTLTADDFTWENTSKVYDGEGSVTLYGTLIDTSILSEGDTFAVEATAVLDSAEAGSRAAAITAYSVTEGESRYLSSSIIGTTVPYNVWFTADISLEDGTNIADGELSFTKDGEQYTPIDGETAGTYVFKEAPGTVIGYMFSRTGYKPLPGTITLDKSSQDITLSPELKDDPGLLNAIDLSLRYKDAPVSIEGLAIAANGYDGSITYQVADGEAFTIDGTTLTILAPGTGTIRATASETDYFKEGYIDITVTVMPQDLNTLTADNFTWEGTEKAYDGKVEVTLTGTLADTSILDEGDAFTVEVKASLDSAEAGARSAAITSFAVTEGAEKYTASSIIGTTVPYNVWFTADISLEDETVIADGELTFTKDGEAYTPEERSTDGSYVFKETPGTVIGYMFNRTGYKPLPGTITLDKSSQDITLSPELKDDPGLIQAKELSLHYMDGTVSIEGLAKAADNYDGAITYEVSDGDAFAVEGLTLTVLKTGETTIRATASETDYFKEAYIDIPVTVEKKDLGVLTSGLFTWTNTRKVFDGQKDVIINGTLIYTSALAAGDTLTVEAKAVLDDPEPGARTAVINSYTIKNGADNYTFTFEEGSAVSYTVSQAEAIFTVDDGTAPEEGEMTFRTEDGTAVTPEEGSVKGEFFFNEQIGTKLLYTFTRDGYKALEGSISLTRRPVSITLAPVKLEVNELVQAKELDLTYTDLTASLEGLVSTSEGYTDGVTYEVCEGDAFTVDGTTLTVVKTGTATLRASTVRTPRYEANYIDIVVTVEKTDLGILPADAFTWDKQEKMYDGSDKAVVAGTLTDTSLLREGESLTVVANATLDSAKPDAKEAVIDGFAITTGGDSYTFEFEDGAALPYTVIPYMVTFALSDGTAPSEGEITIVKENGGAPAYEAGEKEGEYLFTEPEGQKITYTFFREDYKPVSDTVTLQAQPSNVNITLTPKEVNELVQTRELSIKYTDTVVSLKDLIKSSFDDYDGRITYSVAEGDAFTVEGDELYPVKVGGGILHVDAAVTDDYKAAAVDIKVTVEKTDLGTLSPDAFTWEDVEKVYDSFDTAVIKGTLNDTSVLREGEDLTITADVRLNSPDAGERVATIESCTITEGDESYVFGFEEGASVSYTVKKAEVKVKAYDMQAEQYSNTWEMLCGGALPKDWLGSISVTSDDEYVQAEAEGLDLSMYITLSIKAGDYGIGEYLGAIALALSGEKYKNIDFVPEEEPNGTLTISRSSVSVSFSGAGPKNGYYFNTNRTLTITFTEPEFDESRAAIALSLNGTAGLYGVRELSNLSGINFISYNTRAGMHIYRYTVLAEKDAENEYTLDVTYDDGSSIKHADFGNTAAGTYFIMDAKDPEAPSLSFDAEPSNGYYTKDMSLTVNYKDTKSTYGGLDVISLAYENTETKEGTNSIVNEGVNNSAAPVRDYTYTYAVPTGTNNGTVTYTAVATDLAGNTSTTVKEIKIDTVLPEVTVSYLQNSPSNGMYFNATRTMELKIVEKNFSEDLVMISLTENGEDKSTTLKDLLASPGEGKNVYAVSSSNDEYVYRIEFGTSASADVEYTLSIYALDKAGNRGNASYGESAAATHFVIDKVAPVLTLTFTDMSGLPFSPSTVSMGAFTRSGVVATLNVTERHFTDYGSFGVLGLGITSTDINGADNAAYPDTNIQAAKNLALWTSSGEAHSYRMEGFASDSNYSISASFTDLAGNIAGYSVHYFTVDKTAPSGSVSFTSQDGTETSTVLNTAHRFYYFSRGSVPMSVDASDLISGISNVAYYIYDPGSEARGTFSGLSYETLQSVPWTAWNGSATLTPDDAGVIYARIMDYAGNVTYLSTVSGVIVDSTAPSQPNISITSGASVYGAYNTDVSVTLYAEEPENGGTYAGLRSLSYTVTSGGKITQSGDFDTDLSDRTARTRSISRNITVNAADNNTNEVVISVTATDWSGNTTNAKRTIKIDTVKPVIDVSYDINEPLNGKYYNQSRTATIRVTDRNFISSAVTIIVNDLDGNAKPIYGAWTVDATEGTSDAEYSERTVTFSADGDYTLSVSVQDAAGNTSEYTSTGDFVIDKTAPVIDVSFDNNTPENEMYFNASRQAKVSITEKNFSSDDVNVTLTAELEDDKAKAPSLGEWSTEDLVNTSLMDFTTDGNYRLTVNYTDLAGNSAMAYTGDEFVIDCTAPELTIRGVSDRSANRGDVEITIAAADTNIGEATATAVLTGTRHEAETIANAMTLIDDEWVMTLPEFKHEPDVDDIYTLSAAITDQAGNVTSKQVTFSINRFGSNYSFDDDTEKLLDKYYLTLCGDCVVYETNVDILSTHKVSISHDGSITVLEEDKGYKVEAEESDEGWRQYKYTIYADNFDDEGLYELLISSTDEAGNSQDNKLKDYGMTFIVDKSAPSVVFADLEPNARYREASHPFTVVLQDNVSMESAMLYVDGQMMLAFNKGEIDALGGKLSYELSSADTWQSVKVIASDSAGNETTSESNNILVSSDFWIQFKANTPLFAGSIAGVSALAAAAVGAVLYRRRRKAAA